MTISFLLPAIRRAGRHARHRPLGLPHGCLVPQPARRWASQSRAQAAACALCCARSCAARTCTPPTGHFSAALLGRPAAAFSSSIPCMAGVRGSGTTFWGVPAVPGVPARRLACAPAALLPCMAACRRAAAVGSLGQSAPWAQHPPPPPPPGGGRRQVFGRHVACRPPAGRQRDCSERSAGSGRQTQRPPGAQLSASFVKFCWPAPAAAAVCGAVL